MEERNAQVAERVLGWRAVTDRAELDRLEGASDERFHRRRIWYNAQDECQACEECGDMPQFWSEIPAMWMGVDALTAHGFVVQLSIRQGSASATLWEVAHDDTDAEDFFHGGGTTLPESLCNAALAAYPEKEA